MAKITPARITYFLGNGNTTKQEIRFHAVIAEVHEASSEVTKFPVQSGFQVSNHAIRHNRKVVIEAIITNSLIAGGSTAYQYSSTDNNKTIFKVLKDLVNLRIKTTVTTNLGEYEPVLFTSFKTKQVAGSVDSMKVILTGEELQVANALNATAPTLIYWTIVSGPARVAKVLALNNIGIHPSSNEVIQTAKVNMGEDFIIGGGSGSGGTGGTSGGAGGASGGAGGTGNPNDLGQSFTTTYLCKGFDPTTNTYAYEVHTNDTELYIEPSVEVAAAAAAAAPDASDLAAGAQPVSLCIMEGVEDILEEEAAEYLETAAGTLKKSARGAFYSTMAMASSDVGQQLIGLSTGCAIRGAIGAPAEYPYLPGESLPTTEQIINGAKTTGSFLTNPNVTAAGIPLAETELTLITH